MKAIIPVTTAAMLMRVMADSLAAAKPAFQKFPKCLRESSFSSLKREDESKYFQTWLEGFFRHKMHNNGVFGVFF